ncbi:CYTH domain-containing protein [Candidatus Pacearchaeota archaeon]|nr:CYTH domain-containing protein [Candidatus Pacearchaeota archaeon]
MPIEVEIRSFISKEQYEQLLEFFKENAKLKKEDYQETSYFDCEQDLRIQKNDFTSKVWLKQGQIHDEQREETEIHFKKENFEDLEKLFTQLGYSTEIKWFRKRHEFEWENITVCIDYTKGYGHIIELEKLCEEKDQNQELENLKEKLKTLNIELTPKEKFKEKFEHYKNNWKELTKK